MGALPARSILAPVGETPGGLLDPHGRQLDYLRVAITDRCNLRCRYCMPANGVPLIPRAELLSFEELGSLLRVFCELGVRKIRFTGGEPLTRPGILPWLQELSDLPGSPELLITTNGLLIRDSLPQLISAGFKRINLSLDTLVPETWKAVTRRDGFDLAFGAIDEILDAGLGLKLNMVVQPGVNDHEIDDFVALTRDRDLTIRFIEPMPFSGSGGEAIEPISGAEILERIDSRFELRERPRPACSVDRVFDVDGHRGRIGVIEGHTRSFCGSCNRLRIDTRGQLRTCLYGKTAVDLRSLLRSGSDEAAIIEHVTDAVSRRAIDGHVAQLQRDSTESMVQIGG